MLIPLISNGVTAAATFELLNGMSTYSDADVPPPRQSDTFSAAVSAWISPTASCSAAAPVQLAWPTLIWEVPALPSLVAIIVMGPAATPVTSPVELTVALNPLDVAHTTWRPVSGLPFPSRVLAVSCWVAPTAIEAVEGETVTIATGEG